MANFYLVGEPMDIRHIDRPDKTLYPNLDDSVVPVNGWGLPQITDITKRGPLVNARVTWKAKADDYGVFDFSSKRWTEYSQFYPLPYLFALDKEGKHINLWLKYECEIFSSGRGCSR